MLHALSPLGYHHTCHECKTLTEHALETLRVTQDPTGAVAMAHHCACGASEHFTTTLTAADERPETPGNTPERAELARMVRELMRRRGLALVP